MWDVTIDILRIIVTPFFWIGAILAPLFLIAVGALAIISPIYIAFTIIFFVFGWPDWIVQRDLQYHGFKPQTLSEWLQSPSAAQETPAPSPPSSSTGGGHTLKLTADSNGLFVATCTINNVNFACIMDTGATMGPKIMLEIDSRTARKVGIDTSRIRWTESLVTRCVSK